MQTHHTSSYRKGQCLTVVRCVRSVTSPLLALSLWGGAAFAQMPLAEIPLNHAVIESLQNAVELSPQAQAPRSAKVQDAIVPGDALSTALTARVELRFNDGSLARVGGQALVRFVPKARTLQLSNGTLLLLVPPGRGQTRIQTPNAAADIHGSALFVRYMPQTNVTLIGALTSGITLSNSDRSQSLVMEAGQLAVVANEQIEQVHRFDLKTFYETSTLVKGLALEQWVPGTRPEATDVAIAAVRAETAEAAKSQASLDNFSEVQPEVTESTVQTQRSIVPPNAESRSVTGSAQPSSTPQRPETATPPAAIAPPTRTLIAPAAVTLPTTIPPTLALPTTMPLVNPPAAIVPPAPSLPIVVPSVGKPPLSEAPVNSSINPGL